MTDASAMPSADRPVRLALLGCGRVAQLIHLPALRATPSIRVTVLAEPDGDNLAAAGATFPDAATECDWRTALGRDDVDAVVICLPTHLHAEAAVAALGAGLHVYVEKPVAVDAAEARKLVEAERASDRVAMSGFNFRYHPTFQAMRRRLLAGEAGEVVAVRTIFTVPPRALPSWKTDRKTGGGAMLDQLSHHADLLRYLLEGVTDARPREATALARGVRSEADTAAVTTRLAGGVLAQTTLSMATAEQDRVEVLGINGRVVADRVRGQCWFEPAGGGYTRPDRTIRLLESGFRAVGLTKNVLKPTGESGHRGALAAFAEAIQKGEKASPTLEQGVRSLAWVLAAERSAAEDGKVAGIDNAALGLDDEPEPAAATAGEGFPPARDLPPIDFPDEGEDRPLASVVLVASAPDESIRGVARHVRRQTIAGRLELIVVAPTRADAEFIAGRDDDEEEPLGWVKLIGLDRAIENVDAEAAAGLLAARGPVTAVIEDHAYPAADWVERMVEAYRQPGGKVGGTVSIVRNANPDSPLSWANLLIAYGVWYEPLAPGETAAGNHNVSFRTDAVSVYGESLADRLSRAGSIMADLRARGFDVNIVPGARVYHTNPSKLKSTVGLRLDGGRIFAAGKAKLERWPRWRRVGYALASPLIVPVRWRLLRGKVAGLGLKTKAALLFALGLDAAGQGLGFAFGPGGTAPRLQAFEIGRMRHLNKRDRKRMGAPTLRLDEPVTFSDKRQAGRPNTVATPPQPLAQQS